MKEWTTLAGMEIPPPPTERTAEDLWKVAHEARKVLKVALEEKHETATKPGCDWATFAAVTLMTGALGGEHGVLKKTAVSDADPAHPLELRRELTAQRRWFHHETALTGAEEMRARAARAAANADLALHNRRGKVHKEPENTAKSKQTKQQTGTALHAVEQVEETRQQLKELLEQHWTGRPYGRQAMVRILGATLFLAETLKGVPENVREQVPKGTTRKEKKRDWHTRSIGWKQIRNIRDTLYHTPAWPDDETVLNYATILEAVTHEQRERLQEAAKQHDRRQRTKQALQRGLGALLIVATAVAAYLLSPAKPSHGSEEEEPPAMGTSSAEHHAARGSAAVEKPRPRTWRSAPEKPRAAPPAPPAETPKPSTPPRRRPRGPER